MSLLEKIIYVSDCIEPSRNYEGLTEMREEAFKSIDSAMVKCIALKMEYTRSKGKKMHPLSIEALDYFTKGG
jgi:nicotinate-nucleotide adenylyltransferase